MVAGLAVAAPISAVTVQRVVQLAPTLAGAAWPMRPFGTWQMAEAAVEPRITEAGSVDAVAAATVGTVTFLVAGFSIQSLGAAILAHLSAHPRGAATLARQHVARCTILALAHKAAILPERSLRTGLVTQQTSPPLWANTAILSLVTGAAIPTVLTGQAAVVAKRTGPAHEAVREGELPTGLSFCKVVLFLIE